MPLDIVRFMQALLMSVLWNNIQFYKRENNCQAIVITAGGLGDAATLSQQAIFSIESPPHESLSSPYCYLKKKENFYSPTPPPSSPEFSGGWPPPNPPSLLIKP